MPHVDLHVKTHTVLKQAGLAGICTGSASSSSSRTEAWMEMYSNCLTGTGGRGSRLRGGGYRHLSLFVSGEKLLTREAVCAGGCHVQLAHQVTEIWPLLQKVPVHPSRDCFKAIALS